MIISFCILLGLCIIIFMTGILHFNQKAILYNQKAIGANQKELAALIIKNGEEIEKCYSL